MTDPIPWYGEHDELVQLAAVLVDADWLDQPREVVDFFEKPWKWEEEHRQWVQAGRPVSNAGPAWDLFVALLDASDTDDRPPIIGL